LVGGNFDAIPQLNAREVEADGKNHSRKGDNDEDDCGGDVGVAQVRTSASVDT